MKHVAQKETVNTVPTDCCDDGHALACLLILWKAYKQMGGRIAQCRVPPQGLRGLRFKPLPWHPVVQVSSSLTSSF